MKRILFAIVLLLPLAARAENLPVEITAKDALEWNRAGKTFTATGGVVATKGEAQIRAARMTATYDETKSGMDVKRVVADGDVTLLSPPYAAYGDKAEYDVATGGAVLTGKDLRAESGDERLFARDEIRVDGSALTLSARGAARAEKAGQVLRAEILTAHFKRGAGGALEVERIVAPGSVTITTKQETVTGHDGVYDVAAGTAELSGGVVIRQGTSVLEGERATVDMKTGTSRLHAAKGADGRVRGVFRAKP
jgi:lipopolysaccharide export system protein LptA